MGESVYLEFWKYGFVGTQTLIKEIEKTLKAKGVLSMESYDLLLHLEVSKDRCLRMTDLSHRALLSPSGITRAISRLEKLGYVCRMPDPRDKRAILACITESGLQAREQTWGVYRAEVIRLLRKRIRAEDAKAAAKTLRHLAPDWMK